MPELTRAQMTEIIANLCGRSSVVYYNIAWSLPANAPDAVVTIVFWQLLERELACAKEEERKAQERILEVESAMAQAGRLDE